MQKNTIDYKRIVSYLAIYLVWSSTYFAIRVAVESIPPAMILFVRFAVSGVLFLLLAKVFGKWDGKVSKEELLGSIFLGLFLLILGNGLVTVAEQWIESYLAALLIAMEPFVVQIYNRILYKEKIPLVRLFGIAVGFVGVAFLLYDPSTSFNLETQGMGIGLVLLAVLFWGFGTTRSRKLQIHNNMMVHTGVQMGFVSVFAGLFALVQYLFSQGAEVSLSDVSHAFTAADPSLNSIIAMAFLIIFGSSAIMAYNYLLAKKEPVHRVTTYAFINPILATVLGIFLGNEVPKPFLFVGLPLIVFGLVILLYGEQFVLRFSKKK